MLYTSSRTCSCHLYLDQSLDEHKPRDCKNRFPEFASSVQTRIVSSVMFYILISVYFNGRILFLKGLPVEYLFRDA